MATVVTIQGTNGGKTYRGQFSVNGYRESKNFDTHKLAKDWANEQEALLRSKNRGELIPIKVCDMLEKYEDYYLKKRQDKGTVREGEEPTQCGVIRNLRDTLPFRNRWMAEVTKDEITRWAGAMRERGLLPSSVRRYFLSVKRSFKVARDQWSHLVKSPFDGLETPEKGKSRTRRVTDKEIGAMLKELDYVEGMIPETTAQFVGAAIVFAVESAMRRGEILSIDQESRTGLKKVHLDRTKNGDERDVPMNTRCRAILDTLPTEGHLFPVNESTFETAFKEARARVGTDWHFHDLRREATTRLSKKVDVMRLSKITGHRDIKTLMEVYYRPDMEEMADDLD